MVAILKAKSLNPFYGLSTWAIPVYMLAREYMIIVDVYVQDLSQAKCNYIFGKHPHVGNYKGLS